MTSSILRTSWFDNNSDEIKVEYSDRDKLSPHKWICENFSSDDCGCETSTPIVKSELEVTKYFKQFKSFVDDANLTIDMDLARCGLGGCHIHLSMPKLSVARQKLFLRNVATLLTNYPQLNWGFNDPNDNINANSMLTEHNEPTGGSRILLSAHTSDVHTWWNDDTILNRHHGFLYRFADDSTPLKAFLFNPLKIELYKHFALRYNEDYHTLELRIFDMPSSLKQHLLHYDVAIAIYNYALKLTKKGKQLKLKYKKQSQYTMNQTEAIAEFYKALKLLGIDKGRTRKMVGNIKLRYAWAKLDKTENFLL